MLSLQTIHTHVEKHTHTFCDTRSAPLLEVMVNYSHINNNNNNKGRKENKQNPHAHYHPPLFTMSLPFLFIQPSIPDLEQTAGGLKS